MTQSLIGEAANECGTFDRRSAMRMGITCEQRLREAHERSVAFNKRLAHELKEQEVTHELLAKTCNL